MLARRDVVQRGVVDLGVMVRDVGQGGAGGCADHSDLLGIDNLVVTNLDNPVVYVQSADVISVGCLAPALTSPCSCLGVSARWLTLPPLSLQREDMRTFARCMTSRCGRSPPARTPRPNWVAVCRCRNRRRRRRSPCCRSVD